MADDEIYIAQSCPYGCRNHELALTFVILRQLTEVFKCVSTRDVCKGISLQPGNVALAECHCMLRLLHPLSSALICIVGHTWSVWVINPKKKKICKVPRGTHSFYIIIFNMLCACFTFLLLLQKHMFFLTTSCQDCASVFVVNLKIVLGLGCKWIQAPGRM